MAARLTKLLFGRARLTPLIYRVAGRRMGGQRSQLSSARLDSAGAVRNCLYGNRMGARACVTTAWSPCARRWSAFWWRSALSVPLAIVIAFTSLCGGSLYPILLGLQSVPKVALAPLVILWLGIGNLPKIVIVILVCFFPILVNVVAGFEATPRAMLDLMHSLRASRWAIFRRLRVPIAHALPVHRLQDRHHVRGDRRRHRRIRRGAGGTWLFDPDFDRAIADAAGVCRYHPADRDQRRAILCH